MGFSFDFYLASKWATIYSKLAIMIRSDKVGQLGFFLLRLLYLSQTTPLPRSTITASHAQQLSHSSKIISPFFIVDIGWHLWEHDKIKRTNWIEIQNWMNFLSNIFATKKIQHFSYLHWNSHPNLQSSGWWKIEENFLR